MNASLLAVLNDSERLLIAQTERAELAALDEDAAIEFEARIRRARNKYVGQGQPPGRGPGPGVSGEAARGAACGGQGSQARSRAWRAGSGACNGPAGPGADRGADR